jgi:hypothetical protein
LLSIKGIRYFLPAFPILYVSEDGKEYQDEEGQRGTRADRKIVKVIMYHM